MSPVPDAGIFFAVVSLSNLATPADEQSHWRRQELARKLPGEVAAHPDMPPAFLWHTFDDEAVPKPLNSVLRARAGACPASCIYIRADVTGLA